MDQRLEVAQDKFIESVGKLFDSFGFNKFIAQLYGLLYLSDKPLSLDDIVDRLKVSKGSVSTNIRELEKWGAVKSVWVKGSRKDYYQAELDIKKVVLGKIKSGLQKRMAEVSAMTVEFDNIVKSAQPELRDEDRVIAKIYEERMKKIEELKTLGLNALSLAEKLF